MKRLILAIICCTIFIATSAQKTISPGNPLLAVEGRTWFHNDSALVLSWPGTNVTIRFKGTGISAILQDTDTANYYNVIIDGKVKKRIHTDTAKKTYTLASRLSKGEHTVQLFKITEWDKGNTYCYGFKLNPGTQLLPPAAPKKRKIEFFGNSITCGYGIEDSTGNDSGHGYFENNYLTYAAITARHFDAQYHCTSKSGIGIMLSWFPLIMPEMYDRTNPTDSSSHWDFSKYTPDVVVINLFQNDSWLVNKPEHEQFKSRFGTQKPDSSFIVNAYAKFVANVRNKYPNAYIICALGSMDATRGGAPWPGYIQTAVSGLNDKKILTHFFPYKNTPGHPRLAEQASMAKDLISFIEQNIVW
ncbi:SGNH/GDSL hydrolase family protein [Chitinophaga tropicalis]|uniref:Electron transporter RnfD n=1 Tax=Chitinophaga tropicalis TaxID=2683588 RepID=A0A7K1U1T1_9BACT|nr:SGNH/GDSL hydrolase family protein [Chitinophaga tropicalis]MVT07985.1 electron transporter RnfD [Chitinophaga tropicalis]